MRGGALGAVLGAWVGLAALTPGGIAAAQGQPEAEIKKAFETLAAELVANGLDKELGLRNYARPLRVAVWPFGRRVPVALNVAERYHREFVAALQEKAGRRVAIYGPDQILKVEAVRRELGASDDLTLVGNPYAALAGSIDVLIVGAMHEKGEEDVTVSYQALDMKDELRRQIAATGAQLIKGALREARAATPFAEAMKEAARQFRDQAPDMHTVERAGVTYQATGSRTELSDYLEKGALKALVEAYASRVSGRALAVRPAEFRPDAAAKQGLDTGRTLPAGEGAYVLSGDYWDHGGSFEVRLSLTGYDGRSVPWSDHVQKATLPKNLRTRPSGDFGALGDNVKGPIRFELQTRRGLTPRYTVGEKLHVYLSLDRDAHVFCFNVNAKREIFKIFPNTYRKESLLKKGQYEFPGAELPFDFEVTEPVGDELIKCFATSRDVTAALPPELRKNTLEPLPERWVGELAETFRKAAGGLTEAGVVIQVERRR